MIAWRWWRITDDGILQSAVHATLWDGPVFVADLKPKKDTPHGIYALTERDAIGAHRPSDNNACFGEVELSGTVVRGENGMRAERATIRSLYIKPRAFQRLPHDGLRHHTFADWPGLELIRALETRYQVDVALTDTEPSGGNSGGIQFITSGGNMYTWSTSPNVVWGDEPKKDDWSA